MDILIKALQLILSLSILIVVHEFGHFLFARLFNIRVEKFYLFFDTKFSLFKKKIGDTVYGIGWIPLGGYVKIAGMIDESMDKEQMKQEPKPWEFRSKPAWQRLLVMLGGVLFNFIFAFIIYTCVLGYWGEDYIPMKNVKYGVVCSPAALEVGFEHGDRISTLDGEQVERFSELQKKFLLDAPRTVGIEREGVKRDILLNSEDIRKIRKARKEALFGIRIPDYKVGFVSEGSLASKLGIEIGDKIVFVGDEPVVYNDEFKGLLAKHANDSVQLVIDRAGKRMAMQAVFGDTCFLGVAPDFPTEQMYVHKDYGVLESIPRGFTLGFGGIIDYVKQLKLLFVVEDAAGDLGGFISIAKIFPATWDWHSFWLLTGLLSIVLGVMNFLPIPALDGGHIMFTLYEIITGRKPAEKFLERAQMAGMIFLILLLLFINLNDVYKEVVNLF